jgi:hypothetical protein
VSVPEHLWRFPTREAIDSLADRFGLRNTPEMQDWEWEVADPARLDEFLAAYLSGGLSEDERFTLMETLLQCFEESEVDLASDQRWAQVAAALDSHIELHAHTVWYWSCVDDHDSANWFRVTPCVRRILERHRTRLEQPGGAA